MWEVIGNLTNILTLIGVIVAIAALGYQRSQAESTRRREEAERRREVGVGEWMHDLRDWASEAIGVLSEAVYASDGMQEYVPSDAGRYIPRLSALLDRGRFFLPNQFTENHGTNKLPAFRGYRHAALDPLISALIVLEGKVEDKELHDYVTRNRRDVLRELQKEFVSHIQQILDPEVHNQEIARIIKDSYVQVENNLKDSNKQAEKILGRKDVGFSKTELVSIVVTRLRAEESRRGTEWQKETPPERT